MSLIQDALQGKIEPTPEEKARRIEEAAKQAEEGTRQNEHIRKVINAFYQTAGKGKDFHSPASIIDTLTSREIIDANQGPPYRLKEDAKMTDLYRVVREAKISNPVKYICRTFLATDGSSLNEATVGPAFSRTK
jgi:hypothetical protein